MRVALLKPPLVTLSGQLHFIVDGRGSYQLGNWLYHTRVWQRRYWPFFAARSAIASPLANEKDPREGSIVSHYRCQG